jgi:hypothetical protein
MLLLGAYHGLNPGMGWLFAVALGMQEQVTAIRPPLRVRTTKMTTIKVRQLVGKGRIAGFWAVILIQKNLVLYRYVDILGLRRTPYDNALLSAGCSCPNHTDAL